MRDKNAWDTSSQLQVLKYGWTQIETHTFHDCFHDFHDQVFAGEVSVDAKKERRKETWRFDLAFPGSVMWSDRQWPRPSMTRAITSCLLPKCSQRGPSEGQGEASERTCKLSQWETHGHGGRTVTLPAMWYFYEIPLRSVRTATLGHNRSRMKGRRENNCYWIFCFLS